MGMPRFQNLSIKNKLILISMFTSGVVILVALVAILTSAFFSTRASMLESVSSISRVIGTNCVAALTFDDPGAANETLKALAAEPQIESGYIYKADGTLFAQYHRRSSDTKAHIKGALDESEAVHAMLINPTFTKRGIHHRFTRDRLQVWIPIAMDDSMIGVVEVSTGLAMLYQRLMSVALISMGILLLSFLIAYIISTLAQRTISGPVISLTRIMNQVSRNKDYSIRVQNQSQDELGLLFDGFNEMLAEIQTRDEKLHFTQFSVDHMADAAFWMDRCGNIVNINKAACASLGMAREELLRLRFGDIDPTFNPDRWNDTWENAQRRKTVTFESNHLKADGKLMPVEVYANCLEYQGRAYLCAFARDIAERKSLQSQLDQAQKMEVIGTLAAGVAHDLNNILGGMVGYPDLLLMGIPDDDSMHKPLAAIKKSGEKAAAIVQDLLTLARRGVDFRTAVNLNEVVNEYWRSPEHERIKRIYKGVRFEKNLNPDLPNILGSEVHLSKALMNLVSNATEAMSGDGCVKVSTSFRHLDTPLRGYQTIVPGEYAVLRVLDEGAGLSREDMQHVLEPFYTKKKMGRSGTGLGLSVVSGTVQDHKGYIDLKSSEGWGTCFDLYFPVTGEIVQGKRDGFNVDDLKGTEKVLVVDDVLEQREIATAVLRKLGYQVETVSSGEEAVAYLEKGAADILLLDMVMDPGMDGLQTYRKIFSLHPDQKAVVASGYSETKRVQEIMALGVSAYVKKPYSLEGLGRALRETLDR